LSSDNAPATDSFSVGWGGHEQIWAKSCMTKIEWMSHESYRNWCSGRMSQHTLRIIIFSHMYNSHY
jgi:hypothetical protein